MIDEKPPIGVEEVAEATAILQKYKAGKAALDKRIVDNELWFRMGHWKNYQNPMMEGKPQPASGWLFNSIANKHADAMDNYPAPNVLPRAADDAQTAQVLSSILPVVLEQADYEQVYSDTWWRKLKQGTGVKGVFWDPEARGGVGEIAIRPMNLLMLYWEPGVADIQASPHFFSLSKFIIDHLTNSLGHGTHSNDDILSVFSSVIYERTISTTCNLGHFIHIVSHDIRYCIIEFIGSLSTLEIDVRILCSSLCYRVLRSLSPITEFLQSFHINQSANVLHV